MKKATKTATTNAIRPHYALWAGIASIATVLILIAAKTVAYIDGGAASVLASLMDSLLDATVSITAFMAIRFSLKPADGNHRFGHGKIEGLAALAQAAFISLAAVILLWESGHRFMDPHPVTETGMTIAIMLFAIILSAALVAIQNHCLKHAPSLAVESDKAHYAADIIVNAGVIVVMLALGAGAPLWVDPLFAMIIAGFLLFNVYDIGMKGMDMLLDRELPEETRDAIIHTVKNYKGVLGIHDLRTRRSGMRTFISFDIEVDGDMPMRDAHEIVRGVEMALLADHPNAEILIHADPHGDTDDSRHVVPGVHL